MKYINKIWIRILLSIILGGIMSEVYHIKSGNSSIEVAGAISRIGTLVSFLVLTVLVMINKYKYYFIPVNSKKSLDEEILDDLEE